MTSGNQPWSAINPGTGHQQAVATFPKAGVDLEGQPTDQARVVEFKGNCDFGGMPLGKLGRSQRPVFRDTWTARKGPPSFAKGGEYIGQLRVGDGKGSLRCPVTPSLPPTVQTQTSLARPSP